MIEIHWPLLVTQVLTFLAAMIIVWKLFWGPLTQMMRDRSQKITDDLKRAEGGRREIEALEADYRRRLAEIEEQAQQKFNEALARGRDPKEQILNEARAAAKQILTRAQEDLILERERVVRELRAQMTDLSLAAVERLLGQGLDPAAQRRLLDQFLKDMDLARPQR
jgi:F-type H+-transporting ATPase subunit b